MPGRHSVQNENYAPPNPAPEPNAGYAPQKANDGGPPAYPPYAIRKQNRTNRLRPVPYSTTNESAASQNLREAAVHLLPVPVLTSEPVDTRHKPATGYKRKLPAPALLQVPPNQPSLHRPSGYANKPPPKPRHRQPLKTPVAIPRKYPDAAPSPSRNERAPYG